MSLIHTPMPDSVPARYFSLPAARRTVSTCRCAANWRRAISSLTGAWCQAAMYGAGWPNSASNRRSTSRYSGPNASRAAALTPVRSGTRSAGKIRTSYGQRAASGTNTIQCSLRVTIRVPACSSAATRSSNRLPPAWWKA